MVSQELIRIAILWHEMWHEGLEEASRLYFTEKNPEGMTAALKPLHDLIEAVSSYTASERTPLIYPTLGAKHCERNFVCSGLWN